MGYVGDLKGDCQVRFDPASLTVTGPKTTGYSNSDINITCLATDCSLVTIDNSFAGTFDQAGELCTTCGSVCTALHDYDSDNQNWRACTAVTKGGDSKATVAFYVNSSGYDYLPEATPGEVTLCWGGGYAPQPPRYRELGPRGGCASPEMCSTGTVTTGYSNDPYTCLTSDCGQLRNGGFYGTREEAEELCAKCGHACEALHDYNNDGQNWRACTKVQPGGDQKASVVLYEPCRPLSYSLFAEDGIQDDGDLIRVWRSASKCVSRAHQETVEGCQALCTANSECTALEWRDPDKNTLITHMPPSLERPLTRTAGDAGNPARR